MFHTKLSNPSLNFSTSKYYFKRHGTPCRLDPLIINVKPSNKVPIYDTLSEGKGSYPRNRIRHTVATAWAYTLFLSKLIFLNFIILNFKKGSRVWTKHKKVNTTLFQNSILFKKIIFTPVTMNRNKFKNFKKFAQKFVWTILSAGKPLHI